MWKRNIDVKQNTTNSNKLNRKWKTMEPKPQPNGSDVEELNKTNCRQTTPRAHTALNRLIQAFFQNTLPHAPN
jgi:hypothetical protein